MIPTIQIGLPPKEGDAKERANSIGVRLSIVRTVLEDLTEEDLVHYDKMIDSEAAPGEAARSLDAEKHRLVRLTMFFRSEYRTHCLSDEETDLLHAKARVEFLEAKKASKPQIQQPEQ
jgi:hypothetical protein